MALASFDFEGYSTGSLNGQSGWATDSSGTEWQVISTTVHGGTRGLQDTNFVQGTTSPSFTGALTGTVSFYFQVDDVTSASIMFFKLKENGLQNAGGVRSNGGNLELWSGVGFSTVAAISVNTWYKCTMDFTSTQIRAKLDAGSYTSFVNFGTALTTGITNYRLDPGKAGGAGNCYIDDILDESAGGGTTTRRLMMMGVGK